MKRNGIFHRFFKDQFHFLFLLLVSSLASGCGGGVKLAPPVDLTHAGIRIAFPADFAPALLRTPTNILAATQAQEGGTMLFLLAIPMKQTAGAEQKVRTVAEHLAAQTAKWYGVTEQRVLSSEDVRLPIFLVPSGRRGWRTVVRLVSDGDADAGQPPQTRTSMITAWVVPRFAPGKAMGYALWMTAEGEDSDPLAATCDAVLASIVAAPLAPPWTRPLPVFEIALDLPEEGFRVAIPRTWHLRVLGRGKKSDVVLSAAVANHAPGAMPKLAVSVTPAEADPAPMTRSAFVDRFAAELAAGIEAMGKDAKWTLLEKRLVKLGGRDAVEVRGRLTIQGVSREQVSRQAGKSGKLYTLVVSYPAEAKGRAKKTMQKLAETFRFIKAEKKEAGEK